LAGPVDLYHDLEGGEIAAQRPPPPGAGQPYPKLGTVPPKPALPSPAFRNGLQTELLAERDQAERVAADTPVPALPPPPAPPAPTPPDQDGAQPAMAALNTAEAPPAPAQPDPAPAGKLAIVGDAPDLAGVPDLPATPPPPANFEGVPAEPLPTPRLLPASLSPAPQGTTVFFNEGSDALPANQTQALRDFLSHRRKQTIEIIGLGQATSDSPDGQLAAIELALRHARSVEAALAAMHVPQSAMRVGANAFGRGVVLRLIP
jgi:hypothetical protein